MKRLEQVKADLAKARKELEFIEGQLFNESILVEEGLSDLNQRDIAKFMAHNDKLITACIELEVSLEELVD